MRAKGIVIAVLVVLPLNRLEAAEFKSTGYSQFDSAVHRGVAYLKATVDLEKTTPEKLALVAYALFKAGEPVDSPIVQAGLKIAEGSVTESGFHSHGAYDHIYEAGVYSMFLADVDSDKYFQKIQTISDYVSSVQRADGSWADTPKEAGDVSMCQYALLALWAAQRVGCRLTPETLDKAAAWHLRSRNHDGGWSYRPGTTIGAYSGRSTRNMTMAAVSTLGVTRLLLYGLSSNGKKRENPEAEKKYGLLERVAAAEGQSSAGAFGEYRPQHSKNDLTSGIERGVGFETANFNPVHIHTHFPIYLYYTAERALSVTETKSIAGQDWYPTYGNGLLTLQNEKGAWIETHSGDIVGTSLAILYFMRSTKQILDKQYSGGVMSGARGLDSLFGKKEKKKELTSLDVLIGQLESADLSKLDDLSEEEVASSIQFSDPEELIGRVDALKTLLKNKSAENRKAAYFALGRTGRFSLVPEIMKGLRDPNVDVNVTALDALRYISRKPNGLGLTRTPLAGAETASEERRVEVANQWRTKAYDTWMAWYRKVRPFEETDGLDEIGALIGGR